MKLPRRVITGCTSRTTLLTRYFLLRTPLGSLYLHRFHRSDEDRELHDHPWHFVSLILWPGYIEHTADGARRKWPGMLLFRPATWAHRVELVDDQHSWSLVWVTRKVREWGFFTSGGWQQWEANLRERGCLD